MKTTIGVVAAMTTALVATLGLAGCAGSTPYDTGSSDGELNTAKPAKKKKTASTASAETAPETSSTAGRAAPVTTAPLAPSGGSPIATSPIIPRATPVSGGSVISRVPVRPTQQANSCVSQCVAATGQARTSCVQLCSGRVTSTPECPTFDSCYDPNEDVFDCYAGECGDYDYDFVDDGMPGDDPRDYDYPPDYTEETPSPGFNADTMCTEAYTDPEC